MFAKPSANISPELLTAILVMRESSGVLPQFNGHCYAGLIGDISLVLFRSKLEPKEPVFLPVFSSATEIVPCCDQCITIEAMRFVVIVPALKCQLAVGYFDIRRSIKSVMVHES